VSIFELSSFDKNVLLSTPSYLQSLQALVSELFKGLFCQKALNLFQKSEYYGQSWSTYLRKDLSQRIPDMQLVEFEQLLDKNMYGDLSSSRNGTLLSQAKNAPTENKDLYEVMIDLAIFLIVRLCSKQDDDLNSSSIDSASDLLGHVVNTFIKHLRQHETLS
jgi:hypothetical protein